MIQDYRCPETSTRPAEFVDDRGHDQGRFPPPGKKRLLAAAVAVVVAAVVVAVVVAVLLYYCNTD